jgi:YidC/Oxa1 family membrane protein insertase
MSALIIVLVTAGARALLLPLTLWQLKSDGSALVGCLSFIAQGPVLYLTYRFVRGMGGDLFGVPLTAGFLSGPLVFTGLLALIAVVAWISSRRLARLGQPRLLRLLPFGSVVFAAVAPLAVGLYVLTTTTWTAAQDALLRRYRPPIVDSCPPT